MTSVPDPGSSAARIEWLRRLRQDAVAALGRLRGAWGRAWPHVARVEDGARSLRRQAVRHPEQAAALLPLAVVALAAAVGTLGDPDGRAYTFMLALLVLVCGTLAVVHLRRFGPARLAPLEMPFWYSGWLIAGHLGFGLAGFIGPTPYFVPAGDPAWMAAGLLIPLVAIPAFWFGYWSGRRVGPSLAPAALVRVLRSLSTPSAGISPVLVGLLYGIIVAERAARFVLTGPDYGASTAGLGPLAAFRQWLAALEALALLVVAISAVEVFRGRWSAWVLVAIVVVEVAFASVSGFRKSLIWVGLAVAAAWWIARRPGSVPKPVVAAGLVLLVAFLTLVPLGNAYRGILNEDPGARSVQGVLAALPEAWSRVSEKGLFHGFELAAQAIASRQGGIPQILGIVYHQTPENVPFRGSGDLARLPLYLVPRAIWSEKPILNRGTEFSHLYLNHPADTTSSASAMVFGDLYLYAGFPTVILGMFALGMVFAGIYLAFLRCGGPGTHPALYIAIAVGMADIEAEFIPSATGMVQLVAVTAVAFWLLQGSAGLPRVLQGLVAKSRSRVTGPEAPARPEEARDGEPAPAGRQEEGP